MCGLFEGANQTRARSNQGNTVLKSKHKQIITKHRLVNVVSERSSITNNIVSIHYHIFMSAMTICKIEHGILNKQFTLSPVDPPCGGVRNQLDKNIFLINRSCYTNPKHIKTGRKNSFNR